MFGSELSLREGVLLFFKGVSFDPRPLDRSLDFLGVFVLLTPVFRLIQRRTLGRMGSTAKFFFGMFPIGCQDTAATSFLATGSKGNSVVQFQN